MTVRKEIMQETIYYGTGLWVRVRGKHIELAVNGGYGEVKVVILPDQVGTLAEIMTDIATEAK